MHFGEIFHPAVTRWFTHNFAAPTEPQTRAWPSIHHRQPTLIAAPTGSGKTLAAFLAAINDLAEQAAAGTLSDTTQIVYVSPLKALSNDIRKNLQIPLGGIQQELHAMGLPNIALRAAVRTGDTPAGERTAMLRKPPHILVTTPESLYILLTSESGRAMLKTTRTVIVDEIHAMVGSKRGTHLALSLERLEALASADLLRIGLSATQRPLESVARFLVGNRSAPCTIIDAGHFRRLELDIEVPLSPLEAIMSNEVWEEVYDRLANLTREHRTTLIFVNTRRMAERVARHLGERIGDENVASHHGSLSKERRLNAESRLKAGTLRALVATASLELGIDIGSVDLVCQMGSPRSISGLLQRVGRSGHAVSGVPRGKVFPASRDELVECAALVGAVRKGELDRLQIPENALDILAQQIVAAVAGEEWGEDDLFAMVRRAHPYRNLARTDFDAVVLMLAEGFTTRRGRRSTYLHHDRVRRRLRARRGARLAAITSGGAIPDNADYDVMQEPGDIRIGSVNEDFAVESIPGDIFQLGNTSWRILRVERGRLRVEDAHGQPPSLPFWLGEAPGRTAELSRAVSDFRLAVSRRLPGGEVQTLDWLASEAGLSPAAAGQIVGYLSAAEKSLGVMPTQETIVMERFFDESGGMQLVIHAPFGSRINRAWGLALRKRFCRKFNFELQAAATEDAIVLSLGASHSFPLDDVFHYLHSNTVRNVLTQALLAAPMFNVRWRWNANTSLAILRRRGGKKNPAPLQRMEAEDLVAAVFPDQIACAENLPGEPEIPDHPLVQQTLHDCLTEAMDIERLEALLAAMEAGEKRMIARDLTEPSPLAQEILSARPYAYLDDAPLEERRTQAVMNRRYSDPQTAGDLGQLDVAAIAKVLDEIAPRIENADELHDALFQSGFLTAAEGAPYQACFAQLAEQRRAAVFIPHPGEELALWVSAERLASLQSIFPRATWRPAITPLPPPASEGAGADAMVEILRGRLESLGPVTASVLATSMGLPASALEAPLIALESEGFILRGQFNPGATETEWCVRRLLARIHRYTLGRLRKEIEPVSSVALLRFLMEWQGVAEPHAEGPESVNRILEQLEGFEAPAAAWEADILPARLANYDPAWLDALCLSGKIMWKRLSPPKGNAAGVIRTTPIALLSRRNSPLWNSVSLRESRGGNTPPQLGHNARRVAEALQTHGALFFSDLLRTVPLLPTLIEDALAELVAWGMVTADGFTGLRALLTPSNQRPSRSGLPRRRPSATFGIEDAGRWSYLRPPTGDEAMGNPEAVERQARILLGRYGIIFRKILEREAWTPPWRELLQVYRRLEARGEIRGGRFVAGFGGEQFALPEAIGLLRAARSAPASLQLLPVSAADPLNLIGILTPGGRLASHPANRALYRDGEPIATLEAGTMHSLVPLRPRDEWEIRQAIVRRSPTPPI